MCIICIVRVVGYNPDFSMFLSSPSGSFHACHLSSGSGRGGMTQRWRLDLALDRQYDEKIGNSRNKIMII